MKKIDWIGMLLTFEGIFSLIFFIIFVAAIVCIVSGAWWHVPTALLSFTFTYLLLREAKKLSYKDFI